MPQAIRVAAVFKDTNVVKEVFSSFSSAKKATKGEEGITLVKEGTPEAQVIQFPPREETEKRAPASKSTAGTATNITIKGDLTGAYTWVGAKKNRLPLEDARCEYYNALATNTTFEAYLAAVEHLPSVPITTTAIAREKGLKETPVTFAKYAVRNGWVTVEGFDRRANIEAQKRGEYQPKVRVKSENGGDDNSQAGTVDTPDVEEAIED